MKMIFNGEEAGGSGGGGTVILTLTLPAGGWDGSGRLTVAAPGVLADEAKQLIQTAPAQASRAAYEAAGARCAGQGAGSLTFQAETVPAENLTVYAAVTAAITK